MRWTDFVFVGLGGSCGAVGRYLIAVLCRQWLKIGFPVGTLVANVLGCFLMGILIGSGKNLQYPTFQLFFGVGFLGALTTFSTFSAETMTQIEQQQLVSASANVGLNLALAMAAVFAGAVLGGRIFSNAG